MSRAAISPPEPVYRITVPQYHKMIASGALTDDDPIELLEGCLVLKMPRDPARIHVTETLRDLLPSRIGDGCFVNSQEPVTHSDSEPEPDASIVRGRRTDFRRRTPTSRDVPLVIEVANTSLQRDELWKKKVYAKAGIPQYWIVNLLDDRVEVYSQPAKVKGEYKVLRVFKSGDRIPVILDGNEVGQISVSEILP